MASPNIISRFIKSAAANGFTLAEFSRIFPAGVIAPTRLVASSLDSTAPAVVAPVIPAAVAVPLTSASIGIPLVLLLTVPAGATGDLDVSAFPYKMRILDVRATKVAAGGAGDLVALRTGGGAVITGDLDLNVADKAIVRCSSLDPAYADINAGGVLRVRRTQATAAGCLLAVTLVRVA